MPLERFSICLTMVTLWFYFPDTLMTLNGPSDLAVILPTYFLRLITNWPGSKSKMVSGWP